MKRKPGDAINLLFWKSVKGPPELTSPSDGRIVINSSYAFTSYAPRRDLGFNSGVFETETEVPP